MRNGQSRYSDLSFIVITINEEELFSSCFCIKHWRYQVKSSVVSTESTCLLSSSTGCIWSPTSCTSWTASRMSPSNCASLTTSVELIRRRHQARRPAGASRRRPHTFRGAKHVDTVELITGPKNFVVNVNLSSSSHVYSISHIKLSIEGRLSLLKADSFIDVF